MHHTGASRHGAVLIAVAGVAALGWIYLTMTVLAVPDGPRGALGPGMNLLAFGAPVPAFMEALCVPVTLATGLDPQALAVTLAMWIAMVFAMMLPSAAPMIQAYSSALRDLEPSKRKAQRLVALSAGYVSVWTGFAVVACAAQIALVFVGTLSPAMTPLAPALAGMTLLAAGLYQFTPAKQACLGRCRAPVSQAAVRWQIRARSAYRVGLEEGLYCLGCCWALMVVMFAVGIMNVVWMAVLAILMVAEKVTSGMVLPRAVGTGLVVWGALLVLISQPGRLLLGIG
ncbi:DUF2182 domain-containing protein [Amorphus orientalis]|uniref:Metal-binding membrane protein n=1 Tax=Amorphus orientalis TaxID=649198 RepID=A0AAE4AT92_9HYPH|nr:DUF2182 domain-containing protein [Amorphus orientalis]MDQ0315927.1 putative metal-binding membrane protein [Amorphus orientalis]